MAYREASDRLRRQFNQAFFNRLLIDDEYTITDELAEPLDVILGDGLRQAAASRQQTASRGAVDITLPKGSVFPARPRRRTRKTPAPCGGRGLNNVMMVRMRGLEPPRV